MLTIIGIYEYMGDSESFHTTSTDKRNRLVIDHNFELSYFTSSLVSQGISDLIFHRVAESQEAPEIEVPDDGSEYLGITGQYIPYDTSELETVESVRVNVRPSDLLYIYIFGALLIAVSVSVASITVIQMKPRKILSQMD